MILTPEAVVQLVDPAAEIFHHTYGGYTVTSTIGGPLAAVFEVGEDFFDTEEQAWFGAYLLRARLQTSHRRISKPYDRSLIEA